MRKRVLGTETAICLILVTVFYVWVVGAGGRTSVDQGLDSVRGPLYGAIAAVAGALLGFVIATVSILVALLSGDSTRISSLRQSSAYDQIWNVFTSTIRWMGAATLVSLVAVLLDHEHSVIPDAPVELLRAGVLLVTSVATVRLITAMIVLERLVALVNAKPPAYTAAEG